MVQPIAIAGTGLVTSVGLSGPAACAAIRARVTNPIETRFVPAGGEPIVGHSVPLEKPWRGLPKHVKMAAMAIVECLEGVERDEWAQVPLLLCVAETDRPGRLPGLDDQLVQDLQEQLAGRFANDSAIVPHGRVSVAIALQQARRLIHERDVPRVLLAAVDSLLMWPTLSVYERQDRLLTNRNSNGFLPGEAAGAVLLTRPGGGPELLCTGIGFGVEPCRIDSEEPLRADGLTQAIKAALVDADCQLHDLDFRITDISGEQYYFKEAALALGRVLRTRKERLDLWHAAEYVGEVGAAAGAAALVVADVACRKAYAPGRHILAHMANDDGQRAAAVLHFGAA